MKLEPGQTVPIDPEANDATKVIASEDQKKLMNLIKRRHPEYEALLPHWDFIEATYEGGRNWFEENIFRYIKEGDQEFKDRLTRAYRFNHTREVVELVNKYLFKQNITRNEKDAPDEVKAFWGKSTKNGLCIKDFMRQVGRKSSIYGRIAVVVDNNFTEEVKSQADKKRSNGQIYAYILNPKQLLDYAYDEKDDLLWALVAEIHRDDEDPMNSTGEQTVRYRLWTKNDWKLYEVVKEGRRLKVRLVNEDEHGLGEVPIIIAEHVITDDPYKSPSLIDDIAYLDRAVANYLSNLDAIIQDQTFSQLAMPAQNVLPGEDSYKTMLEMGTKRIFLYDGEGGGKPEYLSPDVKQAELIVAVITKIIGEIYHTVGLAGERTKQDNGQGIDNSSGVAKMFDFERVNALLSSKADSLEHVENGIVRLVAKWAEVEVGKKDLVTYPDSFDTRGLYDEFDIATRLMLVEAPDKVRQQQMMTVIEKLFPQLAKDLKEAMLKEVEDWPPKPEDLAGAYTSNVVKNTGKRDATRESLNSGKAPTE